MELFVAQLLNGLVYGVLLFLMAAGLSLIFGLMNVVSLAHGSFFMLGAYLGLAIFQITGSFWLAFILAPIPVIGLGILMERLFLSRLYRRGHMDQVLLTFGFTFVFLDLVQTLWGRTVLRLPTPQALQGTVQIGEGVFSAYRLFLIGFGFAIVQFLDRLRQSSEPSGPLGHPRAPEYLGMGLIGCGVLVTVIAIWQYRWLIRYLWGEPFAAIAGVSEERMQSPLIAVAVLLILVGLFAFVAVLLRLP